MQSNTSLRRFCFTWNEYTDADFEAVGAYIATSLYGVCGKEVAPTTGMRHLQGFIHLKNPAKFSTIKNRLGSSHIEKARGTDEQNREYCIKAGEFIEHGTPVSQGRRSDLEDIKEAIKGGATHRDLLESHSEVCARFPAFVREYEEAVANERTPLQAAPSTWYEWQAATLARLEQPADDRHIIWVYDAQGGHGKSLLARYLRDNRGAFYTNGGKAIDIAFAYAREPIVIFDYVRDAKEFVNYGTVEALKNGLLTSSKYQSITKRFAPPHVLVFANFIPEEGKFSGDRIILISI